jgi:hypothetical protein
MENQTTDQKNEEIKKLKSQIKSLVGKLNRCLEIIESAVEDVED